MSQFREKSAYVCGPLTELPEATKEGVKFFYQRIADACREVMGVRGFVPHEHYDPVRHASYTPPQVDEAERRQVCRLASVLVVVAIEPTWGGGIEVEMANRSGIPVILLCPREKLEAGKISRLLRGNPAVVATLAYDSEDGALEKLRLEIAKLLVAA